MAVKRVIIHSSGIDWGSGASFRRRLATSCCNVHFLIGNGYIAPFRYIRVCDGAVESIALPADDGDSPEQEEIGICLVGDGAFTSRQHRSLVRLVAELLSRYRLSPDAVLGHGEIDAEDRACSHFPVQYLRDALILLPWFAR